MHHPYKGAGDSSAQQLWRQESRIELKKKNNVLKVHRDV
jgi:hypothetical protein